MKKILTENHLKSFINKLVKENLAEARGFEKQPHEDAFSSAYADHEGSGESKEGTSEVTAGDDDSFDADWDKSFMAEDDSQVYSGGDWDEMTEVFAMAVEHHLEAIGQTLANDFVSSYGD